MILDNDLMFSLAQAITAAAASTNLIDTAPLASPFPGSGQSNTGRNLGVGEELYVFITVDVAMTDAGSDSTLTVTLQTDTDVAFGSPASLGDLIVIPAVQAAGAKFFVRLPIANAVPYERYIRLNYTPNNGNLTTGSFSAGIVKDIDMFAPYASGFTTGI
jgi:hypothetical protein